jgi:hypothetical protein
LQTKDYKLKTSSNEETDFRRTEVNRRGFRILRGGREQFSKEEERKDPKAD